MTVSRCERGEEEERMDPEDFPGIAIVVAVTAAVFSPRVRKFLRRGVVYGVAGALRAGDAVTSFARNIGQGFQEGSQEAAAKGAQAPEHPAPDQAKAQGGSASP
jgi:hypothetical protein